ncbi:MAG: type II toxin-antitoxin system PemK/MazF family toxin, partial [Rhodospirillales bacterium]
MVKEVQRFGIYWVSLDPTQGSEIKKTRPCIVISPEEMNRHLATVIVAPMTSTIKGYPTRVPIATGKKAGEVVLDQVRTVDKSRLNKRIG